MTISYRPSPKSPAEQKAYDLLLGFLNRRQRSDLREHGAFDVRGSQGGRYRIVMRHTLPIIALDYDFHHYFGSSYERYSCPLCINLHRRVPVADTALAMLLAVKTDEARLRRIGVPSGAVPTDDPFPPRYVRRKTTL